MKQRLQNMVAGFKRHGFTLGFALLVALVGATASAQETVNLYNDLQTKVTGYIASWQGLATLAIGGMVAARVIAKFMRRATSAV